MVLGEPQINGDIEVAAADVMELIIAAEANAE